MVATFNPLEHQDPHPRPPNLPPISIIINRTTIKLHPSLPQPPIEAANPIREPPINYSFTQLPLQVSPSLPLPPPTYPLPLNRVANPHQAYSSVT
ncbi:hypothetical protein V6N13_087772 [Hibiscus sabdariffa]|uniref:Uncharacterized protein n=1 Tax=Hibiscus sabdariffa TaxID=183260 RepID=A0ABR2FXA7_9ROSI